MMQTAPVLALNRRMPLAPMTQSLGAVTPPPPPVGSEWASRHPYRWPIPPKPEQIQRRWPWLYGMPFGIPIEYDPYISLTRDPAATPPFPYSLGQLPQAAAAAAGSSGNPVMAGTGAILLGLTPIPVIGPFAGIAGATVELLAAIGIGKGCGQTCIKASQYANQAGDLMSQNLQTYLGLPAPRTQILQSHALAVFDQLWGGLVQACSDPNLNDAGVRCVSDREQGACKWKASPGGWHQSADGSWSYTGYGPAGSGSACWNYFVGFRDPIAQDPTVGSAPASQSAVSSSTATGATVTGTGAAGSDLGLLLGAALLVYALSQKGGSN